MTTAIREISVATLLTGYLENLYHIEAGKLLEPSPVHDAFDRLLRHLHGRHKGNLKFKGFYGKTLLEDSNPTNSLINLCLGDEFSSGDLEDIVPPNYFATAYQNILGAVEAEYEEDLLIIQKHVQAELGGLDKTALRKAITEMPNEVEGDHNVDLYYPDIRFYSKSEKVDWDTAFPIRFFTIKNGEVVDCDAKTALASTGIYESIGEYDHAEFVKFLALLVLMVENQHAM